MGKVNRISLQWESHTLDMVFFMTMGLEEHGYMLHKHSEDQVHEDSFEVHRLHNAEKNTWEDSP